MASREGSRKRLKTTSTGEEMPATATSSSSPPNHHEETLKALHTDIDAMRQLVTCKICDRLLYEPYSLSCGHTYCYSCLSQWLAGNHKKTCPDCRAITTQQPTPNYIIRELVLIFLSRSELLPDGETSEEHHALAKEEAKIVADDKANKDPRNGGLFKGCFARRRERLMAIRDPHDNVERCPRCHWELDDGVCLQCGVDLDGDSVDGLSDDLDNSDNSSGWADNGEDGFDGPDDFDGDNSSIATEIYQDRVARGPIAPLGNPRSYRRTMRRPMSPIDLRSTDDEASSEDEHDPTMDNFIVQDDQQVDGAADASGEDTDRPEVIRSRRLGRRRAPVVISDDDDEDTAPPSTVGDQDSIRRALDSDSESEDETPVFRGQRSMMSWSDQQRARWGGNYNDEARDGADSSSSDDDEGDNESSIHGGGGFSPLDMSAAETGSQRTGYNSDTTNNSAHHTYGDTEGNDSSSEDSEDNEGDGWDTRSDTPRAEPGTPPTTQSHRLGTRGQHSSRHTDRGNHYLPNPNTTGFFQTQAPTRPAHGWDSFATRRSRPNQNTVVRPPANNAAHVNARPLNHPFQLGNTLAGISYNQRHQNIRTQPNQRAVSAGNGRNSRGGTGGGVGVLAQSQSSGSSGSSGTLRGGDAGRRKRALSISSDVSYE